MKNKIHMHFKIKKHTAHVAHGSDSYVYMKDTRKMDRKGRELGWKIHRVLGEIGHVI